jgi:uncharacterized protein (TIGR03083 family)
VVEHIDLAVAEIRRMAAVCDGAEPTTPVPTCPGWDLAELQRHVGTVNRWAAAMVERGSQRRLGRDDLDWDEPADPLGLPAWLAEGADICERAFRGADPSFEMWAWGWPKTAGFWPRRMVHESGVHRADAELALGRLPAFDDDVAADAVDELLDNLPHAAYFAPNVAELRGDGEVLAFVTPTVSWAVPLQPDGFAWTREPDAASLADACLLARSPGELVLTLYRRRPPAPGEITGDETVVRRWLDNSAL